MSSYQYDVVVVGAGPAGSMTARFAAAGGCRTLLIEKRQEIGSPVRCGEGLARHFVEDTKLPFDQKWVGREVKGAKIFSPNGTELTIEEAHAGNEVGIVLERDAFDKAVAKEAARAGADIWLKTTATRARWAAGPDSKLCSGRETSQAPSSIGSRTSARGTISLITANFGSAPAHRRAISGCFLRMNPPQTSGSGCPWTD